MVINTVKDYGESYLINGTTSVPKDLNNSDYQRTQEWIAGGGVVDDSPLLINAKAIAINNLANNRAILAEGSTVTYNSKTYANSQNARIAIINYIQKMTAASPAVNFFTYPDREVVQLDKSDFQAIRDLIENNENSLRATEITKIADINACLTVADVEAIDISLV